MEEKRRILYIDCGMGAAGDMLTAALLEIACRDPESKEAFIREFNEIGIPGVEMQVRDAEKNGITGTHVKILVNGIEEGSPEEMHDHGHHHGYEHHEHEHHEHEHHHNDDHDHDHHHDHGHSHDHVHRSMQDIRELISGLHISEEVRDDVLSVYEAIAGAEASVHGTLPGEVHFHEVGSMDAVADITAVCTLIRMIAPDEIIASPMATGYGSVRCAHGVLPVPAPATALLLKGIPAYAGDVEGELCTPTGAALVGYFAGQFGQMPVMRTEAVGYGIGTKDFPKTNALRIFLGEEEENGTPGTVVELSCNIDDMTGEEMGFASERLFAEGALDVYLIPIYMKKNRPGMLLRVMCRNEDKENMVRAVFRYTTTIGIRENVMDRYVLRREEEKIGAEGMTFRRKNAAGYGTSRSKWEYEDLAALARKENCSLRMAEERLNNIGK